MARAAVHALELHLGTVYVGIRKAGRVKTLARAKPRPRVVRIGMAGARAALRPLIVRKARRGELKVTLTVDVKGRCGDRHAIAGGRLMAVLATRAQRDVEAMQATHLG